LAGRLAGEEGGHDGEDDGRGREHRLPEVLARLVGRGGGVVGGLGWLVHWFLRGWGHRASGGGVGALAGVSKRGPWGDRRAAGAQLEGGRLGGTSGGPPRLPRQAADALTQLLPGARSVFGAALSGTRPPRTGARGEGDLGAAHAPASSPHRAERNS